MGQSRLLFVHFCYFHIPITNIVSINYINRKSLDVELGIQTRDDWSVGADGSTQPIRIHFRI